MKRLLLAAALSLPLLGAAEIFNYGFCEPNPSDEALISQGSGRNNDLEVMLRFSPKDMPQMAALKGCKILGVRAMMRCDIERKGSVEAHIGSLTAEPVRKACYFNEGWNEVRFAEPIEIADDDIFIGYRANETQGSGHHPIMATKAPAPSGTYFINVALSGWQDHSARGTAMIQAIIDAPAELMAAPAAMAAVYQAPLMVAPNAPFQATLNIKNLSSTAIDSLTVNYNHGSLEVKTPIPAFGTLQLPATLFTSPEEGNSVPFVTSVTRINGQEVAPAYVSTTSLYVTKDLFTRIPLIEEFTGQTCVNCPFMAYYIDIAREEYKEPHTYVAHHAGFSNDALTKPIDEKLLFLFSPDRGTFNPAVMYDRSLLPGEKNVVHGAVEASSSEYLNRILAASVVPALAELKVTVEGNKAMVSGKVSLGNQTTDGRVFLSAYLIEDDIVATLDGLYQVGVNVNVAPDAPADMVSKFRHNGVIRADLCQNLMGDPLVFDSEGYFTAEYTLPEFEEGWNVKNMHVVAFVHRNNTNNIADNKVLNSSSSRFTDTGLREIGVVDDLRAVRTLDGSLQVLGPVTSWEAFDVAGRRVDPSQSLPEGIYLIRVLLPDGRRTTLRIR